MESFMSTAPAVRIVVVDDFEPWRRQVCTILQERPRFSVVAEVGDGMEAVQKTKELQPDLILLDIGLPTLNGIEAARRISRLVPAAIILFVSLNSDAIVVEGAMRTGAKGYVWKQDAMSDLFSTKTVASSAELSCTSTFNSFSGTVNSVKPHSKQTTSVGNTHVIDLFRPLSPGK
jgi:DNA-binding NarL/FixJ family response regulator